MQRSTSGVHDPWTLDATGEEDLEAQRKMDRERSFQDDMGKVFEPIRKFDRSFAGEEPEREKRFRFSESDYNIHRKREFPHVHHPLKSMHKKKKKRKDGHKSRRKKKKHDIKFRPVLPGVEEGSEPSSSSFESDDSLDDLDTSLDEAEPPPRPPVIPPNGAPRLSPTRDPEQGALHLPVPTGERRDSAVRFADETKRDEKRKDSPSGTPRRNSKCSDGRRMTFLNRMFSDQGMSSPKSSESLKSSNEVAAEQFTMQASDEPEVSKMFEGEDEGWPLVSTLNKDSLYDQSSDKVMFTLGDADEQNDDEDRQSPHPSEDGDDGDDEAPRDEKVGGTPPPDYPIVLVTDTSQPEVVPGKEKEKKESKKKDKKKHKRKQKSRTEHFNLSDLEQRRRAGSEIFDPSLRRVPTEPDEAAMLALADLDDMKSHRFEDARGYHRHKYRLTGKSAPKFDRKSRKPSYAYVPSKKWDHSPHELFVELDVLRVNQRQESEWTEKARWIKFEEDVEEGSNRWGKPHVAYLSFHSLLDLRKCIESGSVILDLEAYGVGNVFHCIVEQLLISDQIDQDNQGNVLRVLQLKHKFHRSHHDGDRGLSTSLGSGVNLIRRASHAIIGHHGVDKHRPSAPPRRFTIAKFLSRSGNAPASKRPSLVEEENEFGSIELPAITVDGHQTSERLLPVNLSAASLRARLGSSQTLKETPSKLRQFSTPNNLDLQKSPDALKVDIDNNSKSPGAMDGLRHRSASGASGTSMSSAQPSHLPRRSTFVGLGTGLGPSVQGDIMRKIPIGAETAMVLVGEVEFLKKPVCAFVRLSEGQVMDNMAEVPVPVRFIFVLLVPIDQPEEEMMDCVEIGRSISTLMSDKVFHNTCYRADNRQDILVAINQFLDDSVVLPPGDWGRSTSAPVPDFVRKKSIVHKSHFLLKEETEMLLKKAELAEKGKKQEPRKDPLSRTGRYFGGLINDVKYRYPLYLSDLKDALNFQCFATIIFIYFAALSPAITFGGLLSEKTHGYIGISETLLGTCLCGIIFALFSGQPLLILGATGPILVFEESMYMICSVSGMEYMAMRLWIGLWVALISVLVVMFDGAAMIRFITQFTEEIFATLISFIFIFEVVKKLYKTFQKHPLMERTDYVPDNDTLLPSNLSSLPGNVSDVSSGYGDEVIEPNTALLTVILCFGTYMIAAKLKEFRNGKFLSRGVRRALGDFGIPLAILIMTAINLLFNNVYTQKLDVPDGMKPTNEGIRGWFIDPVKNINVWMPFLAVVPAFLVFILMFMESQITAIIVNKKDRNLKKGTGYHLDTILIGLLAIPSGLLGFPFMCGATIRSVSHVSALSVYSRTHAPGEKPRLLEVKEQRVTACLVHVLIGISILMGPLLRQIPMAVLFGVFYYMGISSLGGICLIERIKLLFMPIKHHPDENFVKRVRTWRMNLYTMIQVACLSVLWAIKMTPGALAFPFVLILLIPMRIFILPRVFSPKEMEALDVSPTMPSSSQPLQDSDQDEPDFYEQSHIT